MRKRHRGLWITLGSIVGLVVVALIITSLTPWPSAMLIRSVFERGGAATVAEMTPYVPDVDLRKVRGVAYSDAADTPQLDVFTPASAANPLPTVVWIHGGAWISGEKENVEPYLRILAAQGFTTIGVDFPPTYISGGNGDGLT